MSVQKMLLISNRELVNAGSEPQSFLITRNLVFGRLSIAKDGVENSLIKNPKS